MTRSTHAKMLLDAAREIYYQNLPNPATEIIFTVEHLPHDEKGMVDAVTSITVSSNKGGVYMALKDEVKNLINIMAYEIRNIYEVSGPVSDIKSVIEKMGGSVVEDSSIDIFSDGRLRKTGPESFEIEVSPCQTEERRNIAIAHKLGHLFLHMGFQTNKERWVNQNIESYFNTDISEMLYQRNEFADAFLMPKEEYHKVLEAFSYGCLVDTAAIAGHFNVPIDLAASRGRSLGWLE